METADQSDEVIAEVVQGGDIDAFAVLVERYEAKLKRYARKFLAQKEDIEDLVQDVFIKAYTNLQSFDPSQRFSPWIYRIAHNTFVNELKRQSRYQLDIFDADTLLPQVSAKETTDSEAIAAELKNQMGQLLETLKPKYREVLVLHYFEELSYKEISAILKIPVTTVGVRITRARSKLKAKHQETYE